jgi:CARDB
MNRSKRFLFSALLGLVLGAASARAAVDSISVDAMIPPSPAGLLGKTAAAPWDGTNSVEVVVHWDLVSASTGYVGVYTAGIAGNPAHTGVETILAVAHKGQGKGTKRFSIVCDGTSPGCEILNVKVALMTSGPGGASTLAFQLVPVKYGFKCNTNPTGGNPGTHGPNTKPNITSARPGLYIWGTGPKQWHNWNTVVHLKAADSITPNQGNGRCAFNVEYYMKETNGVATGPFKNKIYSDADVRAVNGPDSLAASETKSVTTQPYLDNGPHGLKLVLDADGSVAESNEGDNTFSLRYILEGKCGGTSPLVPGVSAAPPGTN